MIDMNGKKSYLIPILLICLVAGPIAVTYAEDYVSHLEVSAKNIYLTAGMSGNVTIQLYNAGSYDVTEIDALMLSSTSGLSVIANTHNVINKLVSEKTVTYNVTLYVDQGLNVGSYQLSLQTSYVRLGRSISLTVPITVVVKNAFQPMVRVSASPSKLSAGGTTILSVKVEDIAAGDISDVDVTVYSGSPLLSVEDQLRFNAASIRAGSSASFDVQVKALENTPVGAYSLSATVYYSDMRGNRYKQSMGLPVEMTSTVLTSSPIITVTNLGTRAVAPGEQFDVVLRFSCAGAAIYNAKASLSLDQRGLLTPLSPINTAVGDLKPGESMQQGYTLLLDGSAPAGAIPLTLSVRYVDSRGVQGTATEIITVPVKQIVDFSLMKDAVVSAGIGETATFEGDLLLIGTSRVEFTRIQVVGGGPVGLVAGSTEYIGAIDPDSPVPFSLKFSVANGTSMGRYDLEFKLTYMDNRNIQQEQVLNVPLDVVKAQVSVSAVNNDGGVWGWLKRLFGLQ